MPWSREFYRRERLAQYQNFVRAPPARLPRRAPRNPRRVAAHAAAPRARAAR
jgi:hypothetical protein